MAKYESNGLFTEYSDAPWCGKFINFASPIMDVPYHIFFRASVIGLIPTSYVTVRAGLALGELQSIGDLYDFNSIATLFLLGIVSVTPTLMSKDES
ncbi:unnamed protein product [Lupinus luteus]|uniref:Uncharacterized protein n=1 Tax=Lupinus luteus TaxID=3873 RepID=A0AAV1WPM6_LUPLU